MWGFEEEIRVPVKSVCFLIIMKIATYTLTLLGYLESWNKFKLMCKCSDGPFPKALKLHY